MKYTLHDLVPGSRWIQPQSGIVSEVLVSPYCLIYPCYGYTDIDKGYPITKPRHNKQPVIKMIRYSSYPQIFKKYVSGVEDKYINKATSCNAYNFLHYSQPLET